jgi:hypothetical protein
VKLAFDGDRCTNGPFQLQREYDTEGGKTRLAGIRAMTWEDRRGGEKWYYIGSWRDTKREAVADCQRYFEKQT